MDDAARPPRHLADLLGIEFKEVRHGFVAARMPVLPHHMAPHGYLHAASVIGLADTACGVGAMASRPAGAISFTTIELKSNFLGTARAGDVVAAEARLAHGGRTTQVWDAEVRHEVTAKTIALFRCTQLLLYPRGAEAAPPGA